MAKLSHNSIVKNKETNLSKIQGCKSLVYIHIRNHFNMHSITSIFQNFGHFTEKLRSLQSMGIEI